MQQTDKTEMLDLMIHPVILAKNRIIVKVNQAAAKLLIREGTDITQMLLTGQEEYAAFSGGCLYVTLCVLGQSWGAGVVRTEDGDLFTLDQAIESPELRVLALAARELRSPLSDAMIAAQTLSSSSDLQAQENLAHLNRKLYQLLRLVSNMSDASGASPLSRMENRNMDALFREIFEKAAVLTEDAGIRLTYEGLSEDVVSQADAQQLERAALNLLSNSMKFTPRGGTIHVQLTRHGAFLYLRITDGGSGIPDDLISTVFCRHQRQPAIEDCRHGIGLGMVLVRAAAANHGGTVLIDQPEGNGTRITMTIAIQKADTTLHSTCLRVDYAGERDHALIELAEVLPSARYRNE